MDTRHLLLAAAVLACALGPATTRAEAQRANPQDVLQVGRAARGALAEADARMGERGRFRVYRFDARAGERYVVTMRSEAFDAYLSVAREVNGVTDVLATDDDGGGGTDARVRFRPAEAGRYLVIAQSYDRDGIGPFTLLLEHLGPPVAATPRPLAFGQTVSDELTDADATLDDDSFYHLYHFAGRAGQRVAITMRSQAVDSYLSLGRVVNGEYEELGTNDDGGGDLDARLVRTLAHDGTYAVRANTVGVRTGPYTLSLEELPPAAPAPAPREIRAGDTVRAELTDDSAVMSDDSYYDDWVYRGEQGEQIRITMRSDAFDALLFIGRMEDGDLETLDMDDDGAGGTDALLEFTLPASGEYVIRANSLRAGERGPYTLSVERVR